jgi:putative ABC transport system permease protein
LELADAVRRQVWAVDKDQPVADIMSMDSVVSTSIAEPRFRTLLLGGFAVSALALAMVGVFSVMAYTVTQRTHEIGIRMALGANSHDVVKLVLGHVSRVILLGICLGLIGAFAVARLISGLLYGVTPTDPITFVGVVILVALVALAASYIPVRRAMRADPLVALRYE